MEGLLEEKNVELDGLREQLVQVTSDFKFNLKVGCTLCCLSLYSCSSGGPPGWAGVGCAHAHAEDTSLAERQPGAGGHAICQAASQHAAWQPLKEKCCRQQSCLGAACTTWCSSHMFCWLQLLKEHDSDQCCGQRLVQADHLLTAGGQDSLAGSSVPQMLVCTA